MDKRDIKQLVELIDGVEVTVDSAVTIFEDGKVSLADLPVLFALVQKNSLFVNAVQGVQEVPAEVLDLDLEEAKIVIGRLYILVAKLKKIFTPKE